MDLAPKNANLINYNFLQLNKSAFLSGSRVYLFLKGIIDRGLLTDFGKTKTTPVSEGQSLHPYISSWWIKYYYLVLTKTPLSTRKMENPTPIASPRSSNRMVPIGVSTASVFSAVETAA